MSQFADNRGTSIYYEIKGTGEPLVLLMGFGASGALWEQHLTAYQEHFQCIVIDNRGVGRSDAPPGPYSTAMMAGDTIAVMNHIGIKQARIAGISMGGAIAQELALHYPDRVRSLLLVSTWPRFNEYAKVMYQHLKSIRPQVDAAAFMQLLQLWIYAPPYFEQHSEALQSGQQAAVADAQPQSQVGFEGQLDACIQHDTLDRLGHIQAPTLITAGDMDIMTPPDFAQQLQQGIPKAQAFHFPKGGHAHHWEYLKRFNQVSTEFLLNH